MPTIRAYRPGDESGVLAVWNASMTRDPIDERRFRSRVLFDENFDANGLLIADEGGHVAGFVYAICRRQPFGDAGMQPNASWITAFGVEPAARKCGIGKALFDRAEE